MCRPRAILRKKEMTMLYAGQNIVVLDLEVLNSPKIHGWEDKRALGLSIGCYYDYEDGRVTWFDRASLRETVGLLCLREPLMVSFNGIAFDFALMRAILRHEEGEHTLCDDFKVLAKRSYDILAEIWRADPERKFVRGLNSLDAILAANGLAPKTGDGAQAPEWWDAGQRARVMNYCQNDVLQTLALFELLGKNGGIIQRSNGPLQIQWPGLVAPGHRAG